MDSHHNAISPEPLVRLVHAFPLAMNNAVATARTCYSSRTVTDEEVAQDPGLRERLSRSTYQAGHHTTLQHASFQFVLEKVSRHFIWSFLHAHPFYNSEQVSQRYVEVRPGNYTTPPLPDKALPLFHGIIQEQMSAYHELTALLEPTVATAYHSLFPKRTGSSKHVTSAIKKRCQEAARYVLPVATHAHLYHTINGLTLHRYYRLSEQLDLPTETRQVIQAMVREVHTLDPDFLLNLEDPLPLEETLEYRALQATDCSHSLGDPAFVDEFDRSLEGHTSQLVGFVPDSEKRLADAVRIVLGLSTDRMSDSAAVALVLDPSKNPNLGQALNLLSLGKLSQALSHLHFTFRKKLSHSADSQDQRHRMVPASRPILHRQFIPDRPDFIVPAPIAATPQAQEKYLHIMEKVWAAIRHLLEMGASPESALYLLPNSFPVRFEESGDLIHLHHKWTTRLCLNSQEEIWHATVQEVKAVAALCPSLGCHINPPCGLRQRAGKRPYCPEGDRYCGVPAWRVDYSALNRII